MTKIMAKTLSFQKNFWYAWETAWQIYRPIEMIPTNDFDYENVVIEVGSSKTFNFGANLVWKLPSKVLVVVPDQETSFY